MWIDAHTARRLVHVQTLAMQHGVLVTLHRRMRGGYAIVAFQQIVVNFPFTQARYFTALHEIGHCVLGVKGGNKKRLDNEGKAWLWALEQAHEKPTKRTARAMWGWLWLYWVNAPKHKRHRPTTGNSPFWLALAKFQDIFAFTRSKP